MTGKPKILTPEETGLDRADIVDENIKHINDFVRRKAQKLECKHFAEYKGMIAPRCGCARCLLKFMAVKNAAMEQKIMDLKEAGNELSREWEAFDIPSNAPQKWREAAE